MLIIEPGPVYISFAVLTPCSLFSSLRSRSNFRTGALVPLLLLQQLGEHSMWEKYTVSLSRCWCRLSAAQYCVTVTLCTDLQNWELSARVPLIIAAPNKPKSHGVVSVALVELVDVRARRPQPRIEFGLAPCGCFQFT